jgi:hypothetical protein
VEVPDGLFYDPALATEVGAVRDATAGDDRFDVALPQFASVLVVVVSAVGEQGIKSLTGSTDTPADRWHSVHERQQLRDIVAVRTG